jgi:hypothetical protein
MAIIRDSAMLQSISRQNPSGRLPPLVPNYEPPNLKEVFIPSTPQSAQTSEPPKSGWGKKLFYGALGLSAAVGVGLMAVGTVGVGMAVLGVAGILGLASQMSGSSQSGDFAVSSNGGVSVSVGNDLYVSSNGSVGIGVGDGLVVNTDGTVGFSF